MNKFTTMNDLRNYIIGILFDVKGDNEYPSDQVVLANSSLIMIKITQQQEELVEKIRCQKITVPNIDTVLPEIPVVQKRLISKAVTEEVLGALDLYLASLKQDLTKKGEGK